MFRLTWFLPFLLAIFAGWQAGKRTRQAPAAPKAPALTAPEVKPAASAENYEAFIAQVADSEVLRREWSSLEKAGAGEFIWRLKAAAIWERWADVDAVSALDALKSLPMERRFAPDFGPSSASEHSPIRFAFFAMARQDWKAAMAEAKKMVEADSFAESAEPAHPAPPKESIPWKQGARLAAFQGICDFLAVHDPPAFFAAWPELPRGAVQAPFATLAFQKWLVADFPAARQFIESKSHLRVPAWPDELLGLDRQLYEKWLDTDPEGIARAMLDRKITPGTDLTYLHSRIGVAVAKRNPALAAQLVDTGLLPLETLVRADFSLTLAVLEKSREESGHRLLINLGQVNLDDAPKVAAWFDRYPGIELRNSSMDRFFRFWWARRPADAMTWLLQRPPAEVRDVLKGGSFATYLGVTASWEEQDRLLDSLPAEARHALAAQLLRQGQGPAVIERQLALISRLPPGGEKDDAISSCVLSLGARQPEKAAELILQITDPQRRRSQQAAFLLGRMQQSPDSAEQIFKELADTELKNEVARSMAARAMQLDPAEAWKWCSAITNVPRREEMQSTVMAGWPVELRQEALRCLQEAGESLPEAQRSRYAKRFQ